MATTKKVDWVLAPAPGSKDDAKISERHELYRRQMIL